MNKTDYIADNKFQINVNGKTIEYTIIKILMPENSQYQYVVYTEDGQDIFASRFRIENKHIVLEDIEEQYEFDYIDKVLEGDMNG